MSNAVSVFEFRYSAGDYTPEDIISFITKYAKKWVFQKECGDTGYVHYQGRLSLIKKRRIGEIKKIWHESEVPMPEYFEPTITPEHQKVAFYATKQDTRLEGPWKDTDEKLCITRQVREMNGLRPFQQYIVDHVKDWDTRTINIVYCSDGNKGKSLLVAYLRAYRIARALPPVNDYKDLLRMVCDLPTSTCYLFDMPRSLNKDRLYQFFSAVETIKDGYAYDDRYTFKEKVFDCPNIWIFTNTYPDLNMLSRDRWCMWTINDDFELVHESDPNY